MLIDIPFHIVYATGEHEPIEFFFEALMESISFDLGLGFFSSTGINVLSPGFAYFISHGGRMRVIINDILSPNDKEAIQNGLSASYLQYFEDKILNDITKLTSVLSKQDRHFFNCLSYLISQRRVEFIATRPINEKGIAHSKFGIFTDEDGNKVGFNGSANFSANALLNNIESISCYKSWSDSHSETERLRYFENLFEKIWSGKSDTVHIINIDSVKTYIKETFPISSIKELLDEEKEILESLAKSSKVIDKKLKEIEMLGNDPRFPFSQGPREYQINAYESWVQNDYCGIFAMATGTGKTITSLNCVLNEYKKTGEYKVLVLVPTLSLVDQWKKEIESFNFKNIIEVSGRSNWREDLTRVKNDIHWGLSSDFFIISTYSSFSDTLFQKLLLPISKNLILIADEAHNIGSPKVKSAFREIIIPKRIALSATPQRAYDIDGTKEIEYFFNDEPPYCFNFSMYEAIENNYLTRYFYYPRLVKLQEQEFDNYITITKKLHKYFDSHSGELKKCNEVEKLLILRKQIIHKAYNKLLLFKEIVKEINYTKGLHYCFVYVPEGYGEKEGGQKFSYIEEMSLSLSEVSNQTTSNIFIGGDNLRHEKLRGFAEGKIDVLFAMKCLDEGIDIPRAEIGIFASSTGNPRQFIQRRGRLLRKAPGKKFAYIYDMVVIPNELINKDSEFYELERSLVKTELTRVAYFAALSMNFYESKLALEEVMQFYDLDIDTITTEL